MILYLQLYMIKYRIFIQAASLAFFLTLWYFFNIMKKSKQQRNEQMHIK